MNEFNERIDVLKTLKFIMNMIHKSMEDEFRELNITGPQGMIIGILMHHGEMKISDLSQKMGLTNSTVSGIIDRLEKQGMVKRERSSDDRRVVYVSIDEEFREKSKEVFKKVEDKFRDMMNKATDEEHEAIVKGLNTLKKLIESMDNKS
ncbi:MarR family winged helix-turn-helix transcriptional regulator [Thermoanaerobacterium thermosaccharolyticum]|uniref:MarR family winged helix-turn-helix transcriptional regulator n=1 Tax=Thermoanaerobacterium thermosaccharolyticum TaxID=1517 RepID=UPI001CE2FEC7|nr:MarR family transcriptional regulator [Thermoanaerobacterium thermosaccharolyticum]MCP2238817.1 DNA-binding MarR family transcriptional regulator [Thermoanaerobacterium thermosaccharolyticum]